MDLRVRAAIGHRTTVRPRGPLGTRDLARPPLGGRDSTGGTARPRDVMREDAGMTNRTYRVTEIVGTSTTGLEDAVQNAIGRASETLRHLDWFEVTEIRGHIREGKVEHYQVGMKVGFRLEDS